jgi:hypothetical protein
MKNAELAELNFTKLLHYGGTPDVRASTSNQILCSGYCVSCEKNGFLDDGDERLDQMSHGADTDDFERAMGKLPPGGPEVSVAFLLDAPGGYYENGEPRTYEGVTKQPPVNAYYWVPRLTAWPADPSEVNTKSYGPYFAYLLATHKLRNAYFTNTIKCSLAQRDVDQFKPYYHVRDPNVRDSKIRDNCFELFLSKEMRIVNPQVVFYFGQRAQKAGYFAGLPSLLPNAHFKMLLHPAAWLRSSSQILQQNDASIRDALTEYSSVH